MNKKSFEVLGYDNIKNELANRASSNLGKTIIENMEPSIKGSIVDRLQNETLEGRVVLEELKSVPLFGLKDISSSYNKIEFGGILNPRELSEFGDFLRTIRLFKSFMKKYENSTPILFGYSTYLKEYSDIENEIEYCVDGSYVLDRSSSELKNIRRNIKSSEERIVSKINKFLSSSENKSKLQDSFYSVKNGRYVVPIKSQHKSSINGTVVEISSSKSTMYMELESTKKISEEIDELKLLEDNECYQILSTLTGLLYNILESIKISIEIIGQMDFIFARSKYSIDIKGIKPRISNVIKLVEARNPEIGENCIPIDFEIADTISTVVITGPNTGGKTVSLKTVGLLVLLNQSGIQIPANYQSELPIFKKVLVDVGDSQDMKQSLSTFSGHMTNIRDILREASVGTLVLIDEIGTGTDPKDGAAIGIAVLEGLSKKGAFSVVSTHYGEIKEYSSKNRNFINASMAFNPKTLEPLYRLIIGKSGESNAYWILGNIGFDNKIINRAKQISDNGVENINYNFKIKVGKKREKIQKNIDEIENFQMGDRVIIVKTKEEGLVYNYDDFTELVTVFIDKKYLEFSRNQLKIVFKSDVLYPVGYDMNQLFTTFRERKFEKDISKGRVNKLKDVNEKMKKL